MRSLITGLLALLPLPAMAEPVTSFMLDNGLEVVVIEDHRAPAVTHMIWYRAGAADEPPGKSGIAHFLEHLMFKGTETLAPGEFSDIIEAQGGSENAFTSWDYTAYFQRIAADRLGLMMAHEADRMANLAFSDAEWLPERSVVLEERGQVVESRPGAVFQEQMRASMFLNHPYRLPIIGWRHEIAELTDGDAMAFYERFYAPDNAILIVAGDTTPEEVRVLAEAHYGPIPASAAPTDRSRPQEPPHPAERRFTLTDARVAQPQMLRQYLAHPRRPGAQEEAAALTVLAELLGGSPSTSILGRALTMQEPPVALAASAFYSSISVDDTTFGLSVVPAEGVTLEEAEAALDVALTDFMAEGIDPAQFERVRTQIRASEIYALDSAAGRARMYGAALASGLTVADVEGWVATLMDVTPDDVMAAANAVLNPDRSVTGWLKGPGEDRGAPPALGAPAPIIPMEEIAQ